MEHYTLFQLNEFIRRVISLNFTEAVWVQCEILQVSQSRGHYYIQLVQKDGGEDQVLARADAVLWQRNYLQLKRKLGALADELLREGLEVLLQVRVVFDERFGLQYHIEQIDPAFSLGKLEMQRQETIRQLRAGGLLELNGRVPLPSVVQRIAVLSSPDAAGLEDFLDQLRNNPLGYRFSPSLLPSAVQGQRVEAEMLDRLSQVASQKDRYDCVAIIRGGGSRLDLAAFDQLELCKGVARCPLPVIAGIGHEVDESVLDLTAHTSLKTPTAVAEFFIDHNAAFETAVLQTGSRIGQAARWQIKSQNLPLLAQQLQNLARMRLQREKQALSGLGEQIALLDPQRILDRGYAFLSRDGNGVKSVKDLAPGDAVRIRLHDGEAAALIQKINPEP